MTNPSGVPANTDLILQNWALAPFIDIEEDKQYVLEKILSGNVSFRIYGELTGGHPSLGARYGSGILTSCIARTFPEERLVQTASGNKYYLDASKYPNPLRAGWEISPEEFFSREIIVPEKFHFGCG